MADTTDTRTPPDAAAATVVTSEPLAEGSMTPRQKAVLEVIRASVRERGYPPSIREIGDAVGLTSTSSVAHQLRTLERKGFLQRENNRPRAVNIQDTDLNPACLLYTSPSPRDRQKSRMPSSA